MKAILLFSNVIACNEWWVALGWQTESTTLLCTLSVSTTLLWRAE